MSGFGFGYGFHKSSTVVAGYDADAQAYFDAVPNAFDAARKTIINTLVTTLKDDGNWTELDRLWLFANTTTGNAIIDIKNLSSATLVNSPAFVADQGYTSNGSTSYINTNYNPATNGVNYTRNSCCMFTYNRTDVTEDKYELGNYASATTVRSHIMSHRTTNTVLLTQNATGITTAANTDARGLISGVRTASNAQANYRNGSSIGTNSDPSSAVTSLNLFALCINIDGSATNYSTKQIAVSGAGSGSINQATFYTAIQAYMTSLGTQV